MQPAIFLDRDGVLNNALFDGEKTVPPPSIDQFVFCEGVHEACQKLKDAGYKLVVVTNQPDVGRGHVDRSLVENFHSILLAELPIDHIEVCFHSGYENDPCECRKPKPGMILSASEKLDIDLGKSWMVGDRATDIECGKTAGCKTVFVRNGHDEVGLIKPEFIVNSLLEAVTVIVR